MIKRTFIVAGVMAAMLAAFLIMSEPASLARAVEVEPTPVSDADHDPVGAFGATFGSFSGDIKPFPEDFQMFDKNNKQVGLTFGEGEPWRLINFWATWCAPCVVEMPSLKRLQDKMKGRENIEILLVSADMRDSAEELEKQMARVKMPKIEYHYVKDMYLWQHFEMSGLPTTYLVSPRGLIMYTFVGDGHWSSKKADAFLNYILK